MNSPVGDLYNDLTSAEKRRVAPYVTNTSEPVFALTNLPEVVKGALFSRYSRSPLGLRRLLLKEFLAATTESGNQGAHDGPPQLLADRAQDFYDRILDGFGDDSIAELGGAHLALENVSMIATKILEDSRIGGSPLEKSTRYVSFSDKLGGDFRFFKEPRLMASAHRERYLAINRALFETYGRSIAPMTAYIERVVPKEPGTSGAAYRRSVRAKALDALRGLLPASTLTNMGIFGNGRFFETLLIRLRLSPLAEAQGLADAAYTELGKVIPSFIRRANPAHPHFAGFRDFELEQSRAIAGIAEIAEIAAGADAPSGAATEGVTLVEYDADAETKLLAALVFAETAAPLPALRQWAAGLDHDAREQIFSTLAGLRRNRRHKLSRALEMVTYTFDLVGDYGMYRDLHRHRMLTQIRQPLTTRLGFVMPDEVRAAGLDADFQAVMERAADAFEAVSPEYPLEAQYLVPMAYRIRWLFHLTLRELMWLVELRSTPQGHPAYRRMAQEMFRRVREVHPRLASLIRFVDLADYPLGRLGAEQRHEEKKGADNPSSS